MYKWIRTIFDDVIISPFSVLRRKNKQEIESYNTNASDYLENSAPTRIGKYVGMLLTLLTLLTISFVTDWLTNYSKVIIVVFSTFAFVFVLWLIIFGLIRLSAYAKWHKQNNDFIKVELEKVKPRGNDDYRKANNMVQTGKTSDLVRQFPEVYEQLKPPHLWSSFGITEITVMCGMIIEAGLIYTVITILK